MLEIAERADNDIDVLNEGSALVVWFEDQGDTASADRMTVALRARFRRTAADQVQSMPKGGLFRIGSSVMGDPGALIELGQRFAPTHHCRYPEPWPHPWALYLPRALCSKQLDVATRVTRVFGFVVGAVSNVFNDRHLLVT